MNILVFLAVFIVLFLPSPANAASNTIITNSTNLIITGLPSGINLTLSLTPYFYTINGATGTTNYVINFTTQNGNTIVTIPSNIKPAGYNSNYLRFNSGSLLTQIDLSSSIWTYNMTATSPSSLLTGELTYGQNNTLVFSSPFNFAGFFSTEANTLKAKGISLNSSIITSLNNWANSTINLNNILSANQILTANQIANIISPNTFGTSLSNSLIAYKIIPTNIPYGHIKLSGNYLTANKAVNFSVFNSSQRTLYIVKANITKIRINTELW